jgi:uncharacterized protein (DUF849 family)
VLVQACLNGSRRPGDHPALPITPAELAVEATAAVAEGAGALHVHPRASDGSESLDPGPLDDAMLAIRHACPGVPVGVSTAAWIEPDPLRRQELIESWTEWPDFASVNFSEPGAIELCDLLSQLGVGIEAGIWTLADAEALLVSGYAHRLVRVLVEAQDPEPVAAEAEADRITVALDRAEVRPRLYHGYGLATWRVIEYALESGWDIRVGLEDTLLLPDGTLATGNAELVAVAVRLARERGLM